jgi:hypothetical protein
MEQVFLECVIARLVGQSLQVCWGQLGRRKQISGIIFNYMLGKQLPQVDCKLSGPTLVGSP